MIKQVFILMLCVFVLFNTGCKDDVRHVNTSGIDLELSLKRFEQDFNDTKNVKDLLSLQNKYGVFYEAYSDWIMESVSGGARQDPQEKALRLVQFSASREWDSLYNEGQKQFSDLSDLENELTEAFKRFLYHFPNASAPEIITYLATFEIGVFTIEESNQIGIGLDMFFGEDFNIYKYLDPQRFPRYRTRKFRKDYIAPRVIGAFATLKNQIDPDDHSFMNEMIKEGKLLYFTDALLPETADSLKIGYFDGQMEWCFENQKQIWSHLIEADLLFSTNESAYGRYLIDGPFTAAKDVPQEAPPRLGHWIGWQIVKAYMERNEDVTLAELMSNTNAQEIFNGSKYKP